MLNRIALAILITFAAIACQKSQQNNSNVASVLDESAAQNGQDEALSVDALFDMPGENSEATEGSVCVDKSQLNTFSLDDDEPYCVLRSRSLAQYQKQGSLHHMNGDNKKPAMWFINAKQTHYVLQCQSIPEPYTFEECKLEARQFTRTKELKFFVTCQRGDASPVEIECKQIHEDLSVGNPFLPPRK